MKRLILSLALTLHLSPANAHEGHDKTPGALAAPHGGVVKGTEHIVLELVTEPEGFKIYPFDHDMKPVALNELKIEGKVSVPRRKQSDVVKLQPETDHFSSKVNAKGAHRYELDLTVSHAGKTEKIKFSVEPQ